MNIPIYIRAASCISPQQTFGAAELLAEVKTFQEKKINAIEPDYKVHLNIPAARRMSRLIKMGVCAAMSCLTNAGVKDPGAIICGTGLGCMEDSEKFLASLLDNNEQTLSPTSFIFSTHNTVAAQVALLLQCHNYNFTHTHRGLSFENALLDSILFLNDHPESNVLTGAADEVTTTSFKILQRLGLFRQDTENSITMNGAGEGAVFFSLQNSMNEDNLARISAVTTFSFPENENAIFERINNFIVANHISKDDFILTGKNGDAAGDKIYIDVIQKFFSVNNSGSYKHLCGEYHTSAAFACWLSALMLKSQRIPYYVSDQNLPGPRRILVFNHYKGREFSLLLLEKC